MTKHESLSKRIRKASREIEKLRDEIVLTPETAFEFNLGLTHITKARMMLESQGK